jgi:hypothetical protein
MIILAAITFAVFFNMTNLHRSFYLNFKPFNCVPCLSVWSAMVMYLMPDNLISFIATVFSAGIIGAITFRLIHKL